MSSVRVDVAVIGAGTAGITAYRAAVARGARTVLIEGGEHGTTCARVGCMPSKLLIAAAEAAHALGRAPQFGIRVDGGSRIDGGAVMERVRRERDRFVGFVLRDIASIPESHRLVGHARFIDDHTLSVDGKVRVLAKSIIIATGSRAAFPDAFRTLGERLITSDDVFAWQDLPSSVAVIGPGIIGLELGQALHRLGVRVALFGRGGRIGPISDPAIRDYAAAHFNTEFVLESDAQLGAMRAAGDGVTVEHGGPDQAEHSGEYDLVLAATGRRPNVDDLGLDQTTLRLDPKGVPLSDPATARTLSSDGASPIFIAGDAGDFIPLLHEATDEGRIAGKNAARLAQGKRVKAGLRRARLGIVFTDPQIAVVGSGFETLKPDTFDIGEASFEDQGRARVLLRNHGLLHVYGDRATGRFLGAEMIAPAAEHLAHLLAWALQKRMSVSGMLKMPFYHPVIEEGLRTALLDLDAKLRAARADLRTLD